MPYRQTSNNFKAGLFVLASIILAAIVIILVSGLSRRFELTDRYLVDFDLATGAPGLDVGADVMIGGQPAGHVSAVRFRDFDGDDKPDTVEVTVRIRRGLPLYSDAIVQLERPLFGTGATINIPVLGGATGAEPITDPENQRLVGRMAAPSFLRQAGYGERERLAVQNIITRAESIVESVYQLTQREDGTALRETEDLLASLQDAVENLRTDYDRWSTRIDTVTANAETVSGDAVAFFQDAEGVNQRARRLLGELNDLVDANRPRIDSIVENTDASMSTVRATTERVNDEILERISEIVATGRDVVDRANSTIEKIEDLIDTESPNIRRSAADARLAAGQLRLMMGEVRESPWRLLYRPDTRELEYELLYDAARTYAASVSDLRAATESLESSVRSAERRSESVDAERMESLLTHLRSAYEDYETAEDAFLDQLLERSNPK